MMATPMSPPIELLYVSSGTPPDLSITPYGPLVVHPLAGLEPVRAAMAQQGYDAVVIACGTGAELAALPGWPGLAPTVRDAAVLVLAPEPEAADALQLMRLGVQDVVPLREGGGLMLARQIRLAVERHRLAAESRHAYATDLATGLPNRSQLMEHMTHLLALREREPAAMALLVLRVDGLASAAAMAGDEAVNVLRRKVAVRLRAGLRASDVVASIGNDLFAVLLAWIDSPADGQRVARKLVESMQRPFSVAGQDLLVAVASGVAQYPLQGKDADGLLRLAQEQAQAEVPLGRAGGLRGVALPAANDE